MRLLSCLLGLMAVMLLGLVLVDDANGQCANCGASARSRTIIQTQQVPVRTIQTQLVPVQTQVVQHVPVQTIRRETVHVQEEQPTPAPNMLIYAAPPQAVRTYSASSMSYGMSSAMMGYGSGRMMSNAPPRRGLLFRR